MNSTFIRIMIIMLPLFATAQNFALSTYRPQMQTKVEDFEKAIEEAKFNRIN